MMKSFSWSPLIYLVLREIIGERYALPALLGMAGRFDPLLDGNRKQRLSETEFVAIGVN